MNLAQKLLAAQPWAPDWERHLKSVAEGGSMSKADLARRWKGLAARIRERVKPWNQRSGATQRMLGRAEGLEKCASEITEGGM